MGEFLDVARRQPGTVEDNNATISGCIETLKGDGPEGLADKLVEHVSDFEDLDQDTKNILLDDTAHFTSTVVGIEKGSIGWDKVIKPGYSAWYKAEGGFYINPSGLVDVKRIKNILRLMNTMGFENGYDLKKLDRWPFMSRYFSSQLLPNVSIHCDQSTGALKLLISRS